MRRYLLAAAAAAAISTPSVARDNSFYVGIEGGGMIVQDLDLDYEDAQFDLDDQISIDHKLGLDVDLIAGYDFGAFRAEAEIGYKRASIDEIEFGARFPGAGGTGRGGFDADGRASAISGMINLLLDVGGDTGWGGYIGPGIGVARVKYDTEVNDDIVAGRGFLLDASDNVLAWQLLAGVRAPISQNIDLGLKYRFFNTGLPFIGDRDFSFEESEGAGVGAPPFELNGRWRSHSLLASLIFNFGARAAPLPPPPPPAPPPPPPPPPATKVCPDGSVVLATEPCPLPPPPPPPPPPLPERG